jgi:hypothetical protein
LAGFLITLLLIFLPSAGAFPIKKRSEKTSIKLKANLKRNFNTCTILIIPASLYFLDKAHQIPETATEIMKESSRIESMLLPALVRPFCTALTVFCWAVNLVALVGCGEGAVLVVTSVATA